MGLRVCLVRICGESEEQVYFGAFVGVLLLGFGVFATTKVVVLILIFSFHLFMSCFIMFCLVSFMISE